MTASLILGVQSRQAGLPNIAEMMPDPTMITKARSYMARSAPRHPALHLFETALESHLFVADRSRLFDADQVLFSLLDTAETEAGTSALLREAGLDETPAIDDAAPSDPPLHALSLAVAQKCNLGCTYCYAQQGEFGGAAKNMSREMALKAVTLLVDAAEPGARLNVAFLGGEPLANRVVLQAATRHAAERAAQRDVSLTFSVTTNGTLLRPSDGEFFEEFGFAVTLSLDGPRETHNALRPFKGGQGSYDRIMDHVRPWLIRQRKMQVSARVTVTPANLMLRETLDQFVAAGFHSVGFSPLLRAPAGLGEMQLEDLQVMLGGMIECGHECERRVRSGLRYPFANLDNEKQREQVDPDGQGMLVDRGHFDRLLLEHARSCGVRIITPRPATSPPRTRAVPRAHQCGRPPRSRTRPRFHQPRVSPAGCRTGPAPPGPPAGHAHGRARTARYRP